MNRLDAQRKVATTSTERARHCCNWSRRATLMVGSASVVITGYTVRDVC